MAWLEGQRLATSLSHSGMRAMPFRIESWSLCCPPRAGPTIPDDVSLESETYFTPFLRRQTTTLSWKSAACGFLASSSHGGSGSSCSHARFARSSASPDGRAASPPRTRSTGTPCWVMHFRYGAWAAVRSASVMSRRSRGRPSEEAEADAAGGLDSDATFGGAALEDEQAALAAATAPRSTARTMTCEDSMRSHLSWWGFQDVARAWVGVRRTARTDGWMPASAPTTTAPARPPATVAGAMTGGQRSQVT